MLKAITLVQSNYTNFLNIKFQIYSITPKYDNRIRAIRKN